VTANRLTEIDAAAAPIVTAFACAATVDLVPYPHVAYAGRLERDIAAPLRAVIGDAIGAVAQLESLLDRQSERERGRVPTTQEVPCLWMKHSPTS
jgi:hypothetical protein